MLIQIKVDAVNPAGLGDGSRIEEVAGMFRCHSLNGWVQPLCLVVRIRELFSYRPFGFPNHRRSHHQNFGVIHRGFDWGGPDFSDQFGNPIGRILGSVLVHALKIV